MAWLIAVALGSVLVGYLYLLAFRSHAVFMVKATAALQVLLPLGMGAAAVGVTGSWAAATPFFFLAGMAALAMYLWYAQQEEEDEKINTVATRGLGDTFPFVILNALISVLHVSVVCVCNQLTKHVPFPQA